MYRKLIYFAFAILSIVLMQSCLGGDEPSYQGKSFVLGEARASLGGNVYIAQDDSSLVAIVPSIAANDTILGSRLYVEGFVASRATSLPGYDCTLETSAILPVVLDSIVEVKTLTEYEKLGQDRYLLWKNGIFVTGKYLNVFLEVPASGSVKHDFSLVHNTSGAGRTDHGDTIFLEVHHNANNDMEYDNYQRLISFDLSKYIAEHPNGLVIGVLHFPSNAYMSMQVTYFDVN